MARLFLLVLIAGCASAARVGRRAAEDSQSSHSTSNDEGPFDVLHVDNLPRILQDAVPVDAPAPGSAATPGSYGSAAAVPAAARAAAASPQPAAVTGPVAPQEKPAASPEPQLDEIPADSATSGTSNGTTPLSGTTGDLPNAGSPAPAPASGTGSGTSSTSRGTSTQEAAAGQIESIPTTSDQPKVVSGYSSSSSSNDQAAGQLSGNQIAGIVVGVAVAAGAVVLGAIAYQRYKRHNPDDYVSRYRRYDGIQMR